MSRTRKDTKRGRDALADLLGAGGWTHMWGGGPGFGRFWKRCLSKARRRAWRNPNHIRGLPRYESECNWKGW